VPRVPHLAPEEQSADQKRVAAAIAGARDGTVGGPFAIWLRTPEIAERADYFGERLRVQSKLEPRLFELVIITVARHWSAQYEWYAHASAAVKSGISQDIVEAIRLRRTPTFDRDDERVAFDTTSELLQAHALSDVSYERALQMFGLDLLIEMITVVGFYAMVAMVLNAFQAPVPGGDVPLPT
jgi:4-carboxymuconolactone decarboxylase